MAKIAKGIRASGTGIRITLYRGGKSKPVYDKTHDLSPESKADIRRAIKLRDELDSRLKLGLPLFEGQESERRQFVDTAQSYLNAVAVDTTTRMDYKSKLNKHCIPHIGHMITDEISRQHIMDMVGAWELKVSSKQAVLRVLRSVFKYAGVTNNPAVGVSAGRERPAPKERYKPAERDALLKVLTGHAKVYFSIYFGTGMRPAEILALEWADYDGESFMVTKQYTRGTFKGWTKTKLDRKVYVPTWIRDTINQHDTRLKGERLFKGTRSTEMNEHWREAHAKARVGAHPVRYRRPYTCRHTRAAEMLSNGVPPAQAARELGHSPAMFLNTYSEFIEEYCTEHDMGRLEGTPNKNHRRTCN